MVEPLVSIPKARRFAGRDRGDVADAEEGEVAKAGGVVGGEGMAQNIGHPAGKTCGSAEGAPAALPVAGDAEVVRVVSAAEGEEAPAARLAGA